MANKKQQWHCARCDTTLTTFVRLSQQPTHICPKAANKNKPLSPIQEGQHE